MLSVIYKGSSKTFGTLMCVQETVRRGGVVREHVVECHVTSQSCKCQCDSCYAMANIQLLYLQMVLNRTTICHTFFVDRRYIRMGTTFSLLQMSMNRQKRLTIAVQCDRYRVFWTASITLNKGKGLELSVKTEELWLIRCSQAECQSRICLLPGS